MSLPALGGQTMQHTSRLGSRSTVYVPDTIGAHTSLPAPNDNADVPDVYHSMEAISPAGFCPHQLQPPPALRHGEHTSRLGSRSTVYVPDTIGAHTSLPAPNDKPHVPVQHTLVGQLMHHTSRLGLRSTIYVPDAIGDHTSLPAPNNNAYVPDVDQSLLAGSQLAFCSHQVPLQPAVGHGENTYRLGSRSMAYVPDTSGAHTSLPAPNDKPQVPVPHPPTPPTSETIHSAASDDDADALPTGPHTTATARRQKRALARIRERQDLLESHMSWQFQRVNDHLARTHSTSIEITDTLSTLHAHSSATSATFSALEHKLTSNAATLETHMHTKLDQVHTRIDTIHDQVGHVATQVQSTIASLEDTLLQAIQQSQPLPLKTPPVPPPLPPGPVKTRPTQRSRLQAKQHPQPPKQRSNQRRAHPTNTQPKDLASSTLVFTTNNDDFLLANIGLITHSSEDDNSVARYPHHSDSEHSSNSSSR